MLERSSGTDRRGMAGCAAYRPEQRRSIGDRLRSSGNILRGHRRRQQPHELSEQHDIRRHLCVLRTLVGIRRHVEVGRILGIAAPRKIQAIGGQSVALLLLRQRPLLGKYLVGSSHLHVVSLAGEHQQRFVLRFPAKAGDRSIIAVAIECAADAEDVGGLILLIIDQSRVIDVFDQTGAECGGGNSEDDIVSCSAC